MIVDLVFQVIRGEVERAGAVYAGEEKAQGDCTSVYRCLVGGVKKEKPCSSQQCPVMKQWAY